MSHSQRFDLDYRPADYWDPADPVTAITGNITGAVRRLVVTRALEGNVAPELIEEEDREEFLTEQRRAALSAVHPWLMGGEYLPRYLPGELEIARITLRSVTMDVIALRARRLGGRIHYRVVDEYPELHSLSIPRQRKSSARPLTLRQLVALIDGIEDAEGYVGGPYVESLLEPELEAATDSAHIIGFATVTSPFYPELRDFYDSRIDAWVRDQFPSEEEEDFESEEDE